MAFSLVSLVQSSIVQEIKFRFSFFNLHEFLYEDKLSINEEYIKGVIRCEGCFFFCYFQSFLVNL